MFQYERPTSARACRATAIIGGHHVAFYVDDLDAAVDYLRSEGVRVLGEPTASSGPSEGQRWVYFLAPWGMHR